MSLAPFLFCEWPPMTSEHCHRLLDDVTICRHLAIASAFEYSVHPALTSCSLLSYHMSLKILRCNDGAEEGLLEAVGHKFSGVMMVLMRASLRQ